MTFFDILIIGILSLSAIISLFRGFFKEVISLVTWLVAVWAAFTFASDLAPKLLPYIPFINDLPLAKSLIVQALISGVLIFFGILLIGSLVNYVFSLAVQKTGLTGSDRLLGMLFGIARGGLIIALMTLMLGKSELVQQESWWLNSTLRPHAQQAANLLERILPDRLKRYLSIDEAQDESSTTQQINNAPSQVEPVSDSGTEVTTEQSEAEPLPN